MSGQEVACPQCSQLFLIPRESSAAPGGRRFPFPRWVVLLSGMILAAGFVGWKVFPRRPGPAPKAQRNSVPNQNRQTLAKDVAPLLNQYCYSCHGNGKKKADLALDAYKDEASVLNDRKTWEKVLHNLRTGDMPPENKPQPTPQQREMLIAWIDSTIFQTDCNEPDPGRVTLHRLNRAEYNNTVRDLIGISFQPADDFPADDSGYGFDNIGDVLSMPPILLEKYLGAAERILAAAIVTDPVKHATRRIQAESMGPDPGKEVFGNGFKALSSNRNITTSYDAPVASDYILRIRAYGQQAGPDPARMELKVDGKSVKIHDVKAVEDSPKKYEASARLTVGKHKVEIAFINDYMSPPEPKKSRKDRNLFIDYLEVVAPPGAVPLPESHVRIFGRNSEPTSGSAQSIVRRFATLAYRRPVSDVEVKRLMRFFELGQKNGEKFERGVEVALQAILVSPHFLFRGELQPEPNNPRVVHAINEYALASRLSYFLWSSMPDEELFRLAGQGTLRKNLETQVKRMLRDSKAHALVDNFAGQWLQLRNLKLISPDPDEFPEFDEDLRKSMQQETELFFETIVREDRSVLEFLTADYTFLNDRLARHYKLPPVKGEAFLRVSLVGTPRRGLLTQGSVLTITSNPTRTSPVKRGKWVLENILGTPPPPPPPEVPELSEAREKVLSGTLRQRLEQHREDPVCASCHARMDPIGFGLENFDGIGGWRQKDGKFAIEPAGKLVSGETFNGPTELTQILAQRKKEDFVRCLAEKLLIYALGRGLEYYDRCALDRIAQEVPKSNYEFSGLILEVVRSTPFQKRRGEGDRFMQASR